MEFNKILRLSSYLMLGGAILFYLFPTLQGKCITQACFTYMVFFLSFLFSMLGHYYSKKFNLSNQSKSLIEISIWLNIIGELYFYYYIPYYDKILHTIIPAMMTIVIFDYFKKNIKSDKLMVFLSLMGCLVIFEMIEYVIFKSTVYPAMGVISMSGQQLMQPLDDTFVDLFCGMTGSLVIVLLKQENEITKKK